MALTYAQFKTTVANLLAAPEDNADFLQILPSAISYAEDRIYRQFSFLNSQRTVPGDTQLSSRNYTLPIPSEGPIEIVSRINVISGGVRTGLTPVSRDTLDFLWPSDDAPDTDSVPSLFSMETDQTIVVGPVPGTPVDVEVIGWINPNPLSDTTTTTYLSTSLPDLLVCAAMVYLSGWQKNFGAQSDNPQQSVSWESQYQILAAGAADMDSRQNFEGPSWTPQAQTPLAVPSRG